jgi:hypothetical protein
LMTGWLQKINLFDIWCIIFLDPAIYYYIIPLNLFWINIPNSDPLSNWVWKRKKQVSNQETKLNWSNFIVAAEQETMNRAGEDKKTTG